jgi:anti-sigma factor RsiW
MNACRKTQSLLFEKADGRLAAEVRAEMDAHLAICPHCQQTFAVDLGLAALAQPGS